jgi:hypothetical protein
MRSSVLAKRARIAGDARNTRGSRDPSRAARGLAGGPRATRGARYRACGAAESELHETPVKRSLTDKLGACVARREGKHAITNSDRQAPSIEAVPRVGAATPDVRRFAISLLASRSRSTGSGNRYRSAVPPSSRAASEPLPPR